VLCTSDWSLVGPACRLIAEYLSAAPASAVEDAVQTLAGVNLLRMAHTHDGAAAACAVLAYGTAKDRKQAVKAMQGESQPVCRTILLQAGHAMVAHKSTCCNIYFGVRSRVVVACAGHVKTMATDQCAHLVLITALSRVDDTALLRKHVISDLQASQLLLSTPRAATAHLRLERAL
jgi:pumilio homology domain family member 6